MQHLTTIFQGMTPTPFRPFLLSVFRSLRKKYDRVVVPCVGAFTVPQIAVEAGFKPSEVITSDISLFSTTVGYYLTDRPFEDLNFDIDHPFWDFILDKTKKVDYADLLLLMKMLQFKEHIQYEKMYLDEVMFNVVLYREQMERMLGELKTKIGGIKYEIKDMRAEIDDHKDDPRNILYVNPPAYKGGYEKMFDFREAILFNKPPEIAEFDWKEEYTPLFQATEKSKALIFWYRYKSLEEAHKLHAVYVVEYFTGERNDFILANRPDEIGDEFKDVVLKRGIKYESLNVKIWEGELTKDSKVDWFISKAEHSLYYRNVWAHRLGDTEAEVYMIWTMDGQIFATVGLHMASLMRLQEKHVFEVFGFTVPHKKYDNINRLLMMCLTSVETKNRLYAGTRLKNNPLVELEGLKTTCLSKYRKVKLNNGVLDIVKKEKLDNGMYRLVYVAKFRNDSYQDCIRRYLEEWHTRTNLSEKK